ncbi:MAG: hypothetical protein ACM3MB_04305 [Acidobacteriota bacterium]
MTVPAPGPSSPRSANETVILLRAIRLDLPKKERREAEKNIPVYARPEEKISKSGKLVRYAYRSAAAWSPIWIKPIIGSSMTT